MDGFLYEFECSFASIILYYMHNNFIHIPGLAVPFIIIVF